MLELHGDRGTVRVRGSEYELSWSDDKPQVVSLRVGGHPACELYIPGACDADGQADEIGGPVESSAAETGGAATIEFKANSRLWGRVAYFFRCSPRGVQHYARRSGARVLRDLRYFGGPGGSSQPCWQQVFDPEPNARRKHYFASNEFATIGVSADYSYHRGNWLFTPGPYCYAVSMGGNRWLAAGLAVKPGEANFDHFEYLGSGSGFSFNLRYDDHVTSDREWESPRVLLLPAASEYEALEEYCSALRSMGLAPGKEERQPDWWLEPIACGWGEQVAMERRCSLTMAPPQTAAHYCTQENYENIVATLEAQDINPGTLVIDDKWQETYGLNVPAPAKWPAMPGFINRQHKAGRHVLLWLRAWHPEGLPADECIVGAKGTALSADPSAPAYEARLRDQVRHMLLDLGADGFKLDFTHCLPRERGAKSAGGIWGAELLKRLVRTIHDAATEAKPDALIMTHAANPYFSNVVDMLRLNDIANVIGEPSYLESMTQRAKVARCASPRWIIDTDNWPSPDRESWLEYCRAQPELGVPSLYYATRVYYFLGRRQGNR